MINISNEYEIIKKVWNECSDINWDTLGKREQVEFTIQHMQLKGMEYSSYTMVTSTDKSEFINDINKIMQKGWKIYRDLQVTSTGGGMISSQAMVKVVYGL